MKANEVRAKLIELFRTNNWQPVNSEEIEVLLGMSMSHYSIMFSDVNYLRMSCQKGYTVYKPSDKLQRLAYKN